MPEWSANRLFLPKSASESTVRERFGYYDENADGFVTRNELYRVIRASAVRWNRFEKFWSLLDPTGDSWTDFYEALDGLRAAMGSDLTEFQA